MLPLLVLALPFPAAAQPVLQLPADCSLGETCYIQNYVDTDPTEGAVDYACGVLSYDRHKGTDVALPSLAAMEAGVNVVASAAGLVRGVRDGMEDRVFTAESEAEIDGRDCGNGVVIRHEDGWETQYCHMKQGSVTVKAGDRVEAGAVLGQIGLSGRTQFPHVHLSVRYNDAVVDPFRPEAEPGQCGLAAGETLWSDPPAYQAGGLLSAGFAAAIPDYDAVKAGTAHSAEMSSTTPAIVVWAFGFGSRMGDILSMRITGPEGEIFATETELEKAQAQYFRAGGKRNRGALPPGTYTGDLTLTRDGKEISRIATEMTVR
ncbi:peptidase M24 [Oceanicola sp. 22II-s10i]|nr:peptidase M24 [Oceanicola sp. 22II-s10i]